MKPYKPFDFCVKTGCVYVGIIGTEEREKRCKQAFCNIPQFIQYLRANNQLLEPGSELAKLVQALKVFLKHIEHEYPDTPETWEIQNELWRLVRLEGQRDG